MKTKEKIAIAICLIIIIAIIIKGIFFFTAEPKVTVDYLSKYNKLTLPEDYDPNNNAADEYQKAFDSFVEMPIQVVAAKEHNIDWPMDFNETEQKMLRQWLASNKKAFEQFRSASRKPYYWVKRNSRDDSSLIGLFAMPGLNMRNLTDSALWNAKLNAAEGQSGKAFEDILMCRRAVRHLCRTPSFLLEQMLGLRIKQTSNAAVFEILSKLKIDSNDLQAFQSALEKEIAADKYKPDFEAERMLCYDELQRNFVYSVNGKGRLAWRKAKYFVTLCIDQPNPYLACFNGPTKNESAKHIEEVFASFEPVQTKTPWQIHRKDPNYFDRIDASIRDDFFLRMYVQNPSDIFRLYNQTKAQEQGVITIIAILRFRNDNHKLPDSFDELVSSGYLQSLPLDPYSNGALVYRPKGDSFTLYSVGENFEDDGGKEPNKNASNPSGDIVFWPVKKYDQRMKRLEKHLDESKDVNTPAVTKMMSGYDHKFSLRAPR